MRFPLIAAFGLVFLALAPPGSAQFKKEKHPDKGIASIERPRLFDPVPVQPGEEWIQLYYRERKPDSKQKSRKERRFYPVLYVLRIPRVNVAPESQTSKEPDDSEESPKPRVVDFPTYVRYELNPGDPDEPEWTCTDEGPGKKEKTHKTRVWHLRGPTRSNDRFEGWAYTWEDEAHTVAVLGICLAADSKEMRKLWKRTGERLDLTPTVGSDAESQKWARRYERNGMSHPEFRISVRKELVEPWKAEDTENFIVLYNTKDQPLLRKIMRDLELCREQYMELFPPAEKFDAVSAVRICKDRDEYLAYGGRPGSAGYWNYVAEELVLYNAEVHERGKRADDSDTFIVLYHEAFHQYIHYSTGELPPHSWFNEGYGDYFSGATIRNGKFVRIDVNPWRIGTIQYLIEKDRHKSWRDIIKYEQSEYYTDPGSNYAQGWSMVYFLNKSPVARRNDRWAAILPTYFETLKTAYAEELDEAGNPRLLIHRAEPGKRARKRALAAAFEGVDLDDLEEEWAKYIAKLEAPRR
ncbi:MAG: DUF1570 domain-containing protein [Planctomycetota bacterium]